MVGVRNRMTIWALTVSVVLSSPGVSPFPTPEPTMGPPDSRVVPVYESCVNRVRFVYYRCRTGRTSTLLLCQTKGRRVDVVRTGRHVDSGGKSGSRFVLSGSCPRDGPAPERVGTVPPTHSEPQLRWRDTDDPVDPGPHCSGRNKRTTRLVV